MIEAIETRYKGYRFRSRLEARWAVFFDAMGCDWSYETEGFLLPNGERYLPDFIVRTPDFNMLYEVKPKNKKSDSKFSNFCYYLHSSDEICLDRISSFAAVLLSGDPVDYYKLDEEKDALGFCIGCGTVEGGSSEFMSGACDLEWQGDPTSTQFGFVCGTCDFVTPLGSGNPQFTGVFGGLFEPYKGGNHVFYKEQVPVAKRLWSAATKARSARFEHGETP